MTLLQQVLTEWPARPTKAPPPGVYKDVPIAEYLRWDAYSESDLKLIGEWDNDVKLLAPGPFRSPAHLRARLMGQPFKPTKSMIEGQWYHCLLLEPNRFPRDHRVMPDDMKRTTKEGKAAFEQAEQEVGADRVLRFSDFKKLEAMAHAAADHDLVRPIIGAVGDTEISLVWKDAETGLMLKARLDKRIEGDGKRPACVPDLKTTRCAHYRLFERDFASLGYHVQGAMYQDAHAAVFGDRPVVRYIAQETSPPYPAVVYRVREETLDSGRTVYRAALRELARCIDTGLWPGYADGHELDLDIPTWAHAEPADPTQKEPQDDHDYSPDITISDDAGRAIRSIAPGSIDEWL